MRRWRRLWEEEDMVEKEHFHGKITGWICAGCLVSIEVSLRLVIWSSKQKICEPKRRTAVQRWVVTSQSHWLCYVDGKKNWDLTDTLPTTLDIYSYPSISTDLYFATDLHKCLYHITSAILSHDQTQNEWHLCLYELFFSMCLPMQGGGWTGGAAVANIGNVQLQFIHLWVPSPNNEIYFCAQSAVLLFCRHTCCYYSIIMVLHSAMFLCALTSNLICSGERISKYKTNLLRGR